MPDDVPTIIAALKRAVVEDMDEREATLREDEAAIAEASARLSEEQAALAKAQRALAKGQRDLAIEQEQLHAGRLALEAERDEWRATRATIAALVRDDAREGVSADTRGATR